MPTSYVQTDPTVAKTYFSQNESGPIYMLNLLRFRAAADYTAFPELDSIQPISGEAAYRLYLRGVEPLLSAAGGEVVFMGKAHPFLIGPAEEAWDLMLLVRHASRAAMMTFASNPAYQKIAGHRTAALLDSRLLPIDRI